MGRKLLIKLLISLVETIFYFQKQGENMLTRK